MTRAQVLLWLETAATAEGKSLGEWLYESLAEPFEFRGPWRAPGSQPRRAKYKLAAMAFAHRLIDAMPGEMDSEGSRDTAGVGSDPNPAVGAA